VGQANACGRCPMMLGRNSFFKSWRMRTVSVNRNAEELKERLADLNEMSGPVFKITNDPRVTAVGKFIRKTSIDELPQLLNVFKGDMRQGDLKALHMVF